MSEFYNVKQIAENLKCDKHRVYDYINSGALKAIKAGVLLVRKDWYEEFIETLMVVA